MRPGADKIRANGKPFDYALKRPDQMAEYLLADTDERDARYPEPTRYVWILMEDGSVHSITVLTEVRLTHVAYVRA